MRASVRKSLLLLGLMQIACSPFPDQDLVRQRVDELLAMYEHKNIELAKRINQLPLDAPGIRHLAINKEQQTVSARLDRAPLDVVIRRILQDSERSFIYERAGPTGRVTAAFQEQSLLSALNIVLEPFEYHAVEQSGVIIIKELPLCSDCTTQDSEGSSPQDRATALADKLPALCTAAAADSPQNLLCATTVASSSRVVSQPKQDAEMVYRVITPVYVPADYIQSNILAQIYPTGKSNNIQYGIVAETNQIFLYGESDEVARAVRMIRDADQEPVHIYFESALVAFSSSVAEIVGAALQNLAYRQFSNVNIGPGFPGASQATSPGTFTFLRDSAQNNPLSFGSLISSLVDINQARVLARPYLFTLSGSTASLDIGDQGYVQIQQPGQGITTSSTPIQVGTQLTLTPTALPDGTIRLELSLSQSQLQPASAQLQAEQQEASATTVLQIRDGESVLIGGLNLQESELQSFGYPFLEKIPLFNLFFKSTYNRYFQSQTFFYVTPRIWRPSLYTPVQPAPGVPFDDTLGKLRAY